MIKIPIGKGGDVEADEPLDSDDEEMQVVMKQFAKRTSVTVMKQGRCDFTDTQTGDVVTRGLDWEKAQGRKSQVPDTFGNAGRKSTRNSVLRHVKNQKIQKKNI